MEQTNFATLERTGQITATGDELFGFHDRVSRVWMGFYRPVDRYDLWEAYVSGVTRTYLQFGAESALTLPPSGPESATPIFAVARDEDGAVVGGWYMNGPLTALHQAYAPREFVDEPTSAVLITEWLSRAMDQGVFEIKGVWVDAHSPQKSAIADLWARSFVHAMQFLGTRHAFCTAAEHAAPRWMTSGGQQLPGVVSTPYPDERYRTTFLYWDAWTATERSLPRQRERILGESLQASSLTGGRA